MKGLMMGGSGSGRHADIYDFTVEDCLILDINWLRKNDTLFKKNRNSRSSIKWSFYGSVYGVICYEINLGGAFDFIRLHYTFRETESIDYKIYLYKTHPNYPNHSLCRFNLNTRTGIAY